MKIRLLLTALILPSLAFAGESQPGDAAPGELVSRYWLEDPIVLGGTLGFPNHLFTVSSGHGTGTDRNIDFSPPQTTDFSLSIGFGPWQFSYKIPLPQSGYSKTTYGKVDYTDFKFEFGRDRWAASLYYQAFTGFYTDLNGNTGNFARIGNGDDSTTSATDAASGSATSPVQDILQRPDIHSKHYGAIAWHSFPLKGEGDQAFHLSFRTLLGKPEPGFNLDFVHHIFYDRAQVTGASPFVPAQKAASYGKGAGLQAVDLQSVGAGLGLATSYAFDSSAWSLDGLLLYGGGAQRQRADFAADHLWSTVYVDNFNLRFGVNWLSGVNQAGLHFWSNTMAAKVTDVRFNSSNMALELSYVRTI